jgi:hypothetical protein
MFPCGNLMNDDFRPDRARRLMTKEERREELKQLSLP